MPNKRSAFRAKLAIVLLALVALAGAWFYFNCPVAKVVRAMRGQAVDAVPGSVIVNAEYQMDLKSEVGGRIIKSALDDGKPVKEGEFLVQLDPGDLKLEIEKIQSDYDALKNRLAVGSQIQLQLDSARADLANSERLLKLGSMAETDLEKQRRSVQQVEQQLKLEQVANQNEIDTYENTLKVKNRQLEKMTIKAPFDGVVSQVLARPGDLIGGGAPIATVIATSRTVVARISEENFAGIRIGQKAIVRFLTYGYETYPATVNKILPTADPATQRYEVFLKVDLPLEKLVPGLTGEVSITVGEHGNALIVPRRALFGDSLFVVKDGRVRLRKVSLGYVGLNVVEVTGGVDEGDEVITDEFDSFRAGDRVRTVPVAP
ncbi:MAG TPA: efflux RND transporter periplasmic adaptor subunit [Opitutaceae bacterium]|jgi:RND family efflux transporter MFP subunit|nr:efflux RND transporter periplasmic adaptor subunit [Opitutaceae bacterium]